MRPSGNVGETLDLFQQHPAADGGLEQREAVREVLDLLTADQRSVLLLRVLKLQTSQATNTAAANTSSSASAMLSGLLSGWANPSTTIPTPAAVAANGTIATPAPAPVTAATVSNAIKVGGGTAGGWGGIQNDPANKVATKAPAPPAVKAPAPAPVVAKPVLGPDFSAFNQAPAPAPAPAPVKATAAPIWGANGENFA